MRRCGMPVNVKVRTLLDSTRRSKTRRRNQGRHQDSLAGRKRLSGFFGVHRIAPAFVCAQEKEGSRMLQNATEQGLSDSLTPGMQTHSKLEAVRAARVF